MSLFNTLELWSTKCGEDETFDYHSIIVTDLNGCNQDKIIVGSFNGLLRVYEVSGENSEQSSFKPSDLLLEIQLTDCIIQVTSGKLVSGSHLVHLCVVHSQSFGIYEFSAVAGSTEHGNQYELKMVYEQLLQHINYQVVVGPFGGVQGRDFICVGAVDGTLSFYEQETFIFECQLPTFLLPSPIVYVVGSDLFVTLSANWCIEAYRYQDLVNPVQKKIIPTWSYNLGEILLDIQTVKDRKNQETFIVALSEHNLICWNSGGLLEFTKRLQYAPICFSIYVNEQNDKLMVLIVSDVGTLYIYEKQSLRWSTKLPFIPLCIIRTKLIIEGSLVQLSDRGELSCCILGTQPSLFVAHPLKNSITSLKNMNTKLEKLQTEIKDFRAKSSNSFLLTVSEQEVLVTLAVLPYDKISNKCQLLMDLIPSHPIPNIQVTFVVEQPFDVQPPTYCISTLCEKTTLRSFIQINENNEIIASKLEVTGVVRYMGNNSIPRLIRQRANISAKFVLTLCPSYEEEQFFKLNVHSNKSLPQLTTLFKEFCDDHWAENGYNEEVVGFCLRYKPSTKCIVTLLKSRLGFTVMSNSIPMTHLLLSQLIHRCKNLKCVSEKSFGVYNFEYKGKVPKENLITAVNEYVVVRNKVNKLQVLLEQLSTQYRLIQRRFLIKLKDKVPTNLSSLQIIYQSTYEMLTDTICRIEDGQKEFLIKCCDLQSMINYTFDILSMTNNVSADHIFAMRNAMNLTTMNNDIQGWSERTLANVTFLLCNTLSKISNDQNKVILPFDELVTDAAKLTSVIDTAIDRMLDIDSIDEEKISEVVQRTHQVRAVSPILEFDEIDDRKMITFGKPFELLDKGSAHAHDVLADL